MFFSSWEDDVVVSFLEPNKLPLQTDEDGKVTSNKAASLLDHAQRVAEGKTLDLHANTWRYNQLTAQQRAILVDRRDTLLRTATAREELQERSPKRYEQIAESVSEERLDEICRLIMLYHLDRSWADHLAYLADIRRASACAHRQPEPARRIPPDGGGRLRLAGSRRHRGGPADLRHRQHRRRGDRAGSDPAGTADLDVDVHDPRRPAGRQRHVGAEPAGCLRQGFSV